MHLSLMEIVLWAAGLVFEAALIFVLLYKRRYRVVPWFTAWIAWVFLYTIALFLAYRFGFRHLYGLIYWSAGIVEMLLQVAMVFEIARSVLMRSGRWVEGARLRLVAIGSAALFVAGAMAWFMTAPAATPFQEMAARLSLFATILICLLSGAVMAASSRLGLGFRSYVMREVYGLVFWVLPVFALDTLHAYWRTKELVPALQNFKASLFASALIYWCVAFWLPEPEPELMTFDKKKDLEELAARLEYAQSHRASSTNGVVPK